MSLDEVVDRTNYSQEELRRESDLMYSYGLLALETDNFVLAAYTLGLVEDRMKYLTSHKFLTDKTFDHLAVNKAGLSVMLDVYKILEGYRRR